MSLVEISVEGLKIQAQIKQIDGGTGTMSKYVRFVFVCFSTEFKIVIIDICALRNQNISPKRARFFKASTEI